MRDKFHPEILTGSLPVIYGLPQCHFNCSVVACVFYDRLRLVYYLVCMVEIVGSRDVGHLQFASSPLIEPATALTVAQSDAAGAYSVLASESNDARRDCR